MSEDERYARGLMTIEEQIHYEMLKEAVLLPGETFADGAARVRGHLGITENDASDEQIVYGMYNRYNTGDFAFPSQFMMKPADYQRSILPAAPNPAPVLPIQPTPNVNVVGQPVDGVTNITLNIDGRDETLPQTGAVTSYDPMLAIMMASMAMNPGNAAFQSTPANGVPAPTTAAASVAPDNKMLLMLVAGVALLFFFSK